ncbi:uncharacterized protein LOC116259233 [Nymphaea colorata]|nr:uncharacterized protein LOC116259233 [Nymphaea colorata]
MAPKLAACSAMASALFAHPSFCLLADRAAKPSLLLSPNPTCFRPRGNPAVRPPTSFRLFATVQDKAPDDAPQSVELPKKRSFAVATGDFFMGLASTLLRTRRAGGGSVLVDSGEGDRDGVASVIVDEADPAVIWERREKDVEAERERSKITSPGFSFSAAGLLFPYHLGVAQFLLEKGYIRENTPLAGSSAGAIVCAVIASGNTMEDALKATKMLAEDCRLNGTAFRLGVTALLSLTLMLFKFVTEMQNCIKAVLRNILENFLPDDVHKKSNGRIRVGVTQVFGRPRGLLVDQFDSRKDLIDAVITSSFIPGYIAPRPVTMYRNRICIDGGLTLFMPPTSATNTVRVCAFPASRLGLTNIGISPDCNPTDRASPRQLFQWALEPAEDHLLDKFFELGYQDAAVWAGQNPVEEITREENLAE